MVARLWISTKNGFIKSAATPIQVTYSLRFVQYLNIPSATQSVPHGGLPIPDAPELFLLGSDEEENKNYSPGPSLSNYPDFDL